MMDKLSIYIPRAKAAQNPTEKLNGLAEQKDRSANYPVVEAILQDLDREEARR